MFINEKILTRLMKNAYKRNGVYMGREEGWYYLKGGYWDAKIAVGCMPRPILALMFEMCGAIPEEGEGWTSDHEKDQYELFLRGISVPEDRRVPMYLRRVALISRGGTAMQVLQLDNDEVMYFRPELLAAADLASVDRSNGEEMIRGPYYDGENGAFWETNHAVWHILQVRDNDLEGIVKYLSERDLSIEEPE